MRPMLRLSVPPSMPAPRLARARAAVLLVTLTGCATSAPRVETVPTAALPLVDTGRAPSFPPLAPVTGSLVLRVVYPPDGATIAARDSTFIFGSVGSGDARLTINGIDVPVLPPTAQMLERSATINI